jgi:hypothetical protein
MIDLSTEQATALAASIAALAAAAGVWRADHNTQRSIRAAEMPFLIPDLDFGVEGWLLLWTGGMHDNPHRLQIPLINVGRGPALMGDVRLTIDGEDILSPAGGQIAVRTVEGRTVDLQLRAEPPPRDQEGLLRIYYTDAWGEKFMTRIHFRTEPGGILCTSYVRQESDGEERDFLFQSQIVPSRLRNRLTSRRNRL